MSRWASDASVSIYGGACETSYGFYANVENVGCEGSTGGSNDHDGGSFSDASSSCEIVDSCRSFFCDYIDGCSYASPCASGGTVWASDGSIFSYSETDGISDDFCSNTS